MHTTRSIRNFDTHYSLSQKYIKYWAAAVAEYYGVGHDIVMRRPRTERKPMGLRVCARAHSDRKKKIGITVDDFGYK